MKEQTQWLIFGIGVFILVGILFTFVVYEGYDYLSNCKYYCSLDFIPTLMFSAFMFFMTFILIIRNYKDAKSKEGEKG